MAIPLHYNMGVLGPKIAHSNTVFILTVYINYSVLMEAG